MPLTLCTPTIGISARARVLPSSGGGGGLDQREGAPGLLSGLWQGHEHCHQTATETPGTGGRDTRYMHCLGDTYYSLASHIPKSH